MVTCMFLFLTAAVEIIFGFSLLFAGSVRPRQHLEWLL